MKSRFGLRVLGMDIAEMGAFLVGLFTAAQALALFSSRMIGGLPVVGSAFGNALALSGAAMAGCLYLLVMHLFEGERVPEAADQRGAVHFGAGLALGASLFAAIMVLLLIARTAQVTDAGSARAAAGWLGAAAAAAVLEEVAFRGMVLRLLERHLGPAAALALSALLFGLAHLGNVGASVAAFAGVTAAGLLLGAAYQLTRSLWLPIGIHLAWNFTESGIFGADVSGNSGAGFLLTRFNGPAWMTGGAFGPEAGLPTILILTAATATLIWKRRSEMRSS